MDEFLSRFGVTCDRLLWGVAAILVAIVLGSILFSPPDLPVPFGASDDDLSVTTETMEGRITRVLSEETIRTAQGTQYVQQIEVEIASGSMQGQRVVTEHGSTIVTTESSRVRPGMRVIVEHAAGPIGDRYYISDFIRRPAIWGLTLLFVASAALIGRWTGVRSLIGTAFSVLVIARFILPRILAGQNPVAVCIVGAIVLMAPTLYLVYGWKSKTHAAALGLSICLVITWILAAIFVSWAHVTGFGKEESAFLVVGLQTEVDLRGLVLGGIILGTLGVLDDVTIGQSSAILELHAANPSLSWRTLFRHGMVIGRDHIASMVNTLMLAYIGASLPLFLLISLYQEPLGFLLNRERLVEEIIRTLVGSIGLMMAVPVTSLIASWMAKGIWGYRKTGNHPSIQ
ncbi:MAG: YibE/F family protein [Anaerolineae bacterium]|nr:YibE/F family protein [Anaerolineae bacterium]